MLKLIQTSLIIMVSCHILFAQNGTLAGRVTDAKTGEPLIGATVQLIGAALGAVTNAEGYYYMKKIPPKSYNINASHVGYTTQTRYNIVIRSEGNMDINIQLTESKSELQEVVIAANPFARLEETPLSIQRLSQEEIASYPGGNNDIAKVVQSLPGVSGSVGGFRNDVIIRGGGPNENVYYLDGVEVPNINHFATQGSAGGPVGLLNVSFFEGVTLTTSSFGAQYDNVLSGVLQFVQRNGNARKFQGNLRVGASESALTLEGPLFKNGKEQSQTTFIASVRRSYLQFLFDLLELPFLPDYWDYQYKINHKLDEYNEIMVTGVGSIDDFAVNELDDFDAEQQAIQEQVPIIKQRTNSAGITWKKRLKDKSGYMQTTLSTNLLKNEFLQYRDNINETGLYFENDSRERETKFRYSLTKFIGQWTTSYGFSIQNADYSNNTHDFINDYAYNSALNFFRYGLFVQSSAKFIRDRLSFSVGARADGNTFTVSGNELYRTFSPRASLSYQLSEGGKWTASASLGRYFKIPPYTILGFNDNNNERVNKDTRYIQSDHAVAGLEYLVNKSARITIEGFVKQYNNYPVSVDDSISLANKGGGFEVLGNEPVSSVGRGRTYGAELLYQQKFNGKFYAIATYTVYKSEFTGFNRDNFIPSTWDNGHLISITGGYKFNKNWEISTRYRFSGETPFTPIDEQATLAEYPAIIRDYSRLGEIQLDALSQLDIRVDKKWNFKNFSLDVYLDIQNLLASDLPEEPRYGLARNDSGLVEQPPQLVLVNTKPTGEIIPSIGLVLNF